MALRESHDLVNKADKSAEIWPKAHDRYPVFRNPHIVVPEIPIKNEEFKKYLNSKPEDNPTTLHELLKESFPDLPPQKQWVKPTEKKLLWKRRFIPGPKKMSRYRVIPGYAADEEPPVSDNQETFQEISGEDFSGISLTPEVQRPTDDTEAASIHKTEPKRKRWLDGYYLPKTRHRRWPGIRVPKTSQRRARSDFLQRLERTRNEDTYRHFFRMKEEHMKTAEEIEQERETLRRELEEEKERELARIKALKVDRSPVRGALKGIFNMNEGDDVPIDIPELDKFCRRPQPDIEQLPAMMQQEERANRAFVEYLDQNGISEMLIGTLFMIFSNPGPQENAKELLRLGLGGKPMETANVDDALQNIQDTKDRITELKNELHYLRVKLLRTLKDNELPDEPIDPNNFEFPKRRMDYLLKAFFCRSRPSDLPVGEVYDLPADLPKLVKYNITGYERVDQGREGLLKDATTQLDYRPQ